MFEKSYVFMNFATKFLLLSPIIFSCVKASASGLEEKTLREAAIKNGWVPSGQLYVNPDESLAPIGERLFDSTALSLNGFVSCKTCHRAEFSSADGIPNAAATGHGSLRGEAGKDIVGPDRLLLDAKQLPRNTLPFWGRGAKGFSVFFWDGKVDAKDGSIISQFGSKTPSDDAFLTAVHLPVVEIREMLEEDSFVQSLKLESVDKSSSVYAAISERIKEKEPEASLQLANGLGIDVEELTYLDYARALVSFIRTEFRLKPTKFEQFMKDETSLTVDELRGGLSFYGNGGCATCHSGAHFSDFSFHAIVMPSLGFGRNGFGVDYGRYNITFDPNDLYKFRTPPLYNVEKTAPYGHSGSVYELEQAITSHFDPLALVDPSDMTSFERHEFFKRLATSSQSVTGRIKYLTKEEIAEITAFLKTLSFD